MKIEKTLFFKRAVSKKIEISKGGEFKLDRGKNGLHKGVDLKTNLGTKVWASERGEVVYFGHRPGTKEKGNYGNVIVIGHVPRADKNSRHIYSLYAHLDTIKVGYIGESIGSGDVIGTTGHSGTTNSYKTKTKKGKTIEKEKRGGFHLHFELIDSPKMLFWGPGNFHGSKYRVNPMVGGGYIDCSVVVVYEDKYKLYDTSSIGSSFVKKIIEPQSPR